PYHVLIGRYQAFSYDPTASVAASRFDIYN
ncbi:uncharacterized protein METZ01_LOCUS430657, partial [marine metagenome]